MVTRVAVLDDYQRVAAGLADWGSVPGDVVFFHDHLTGEDEVAARLEGFDVVVAMRERTPFRESLLARLPALRLLVTTGPHNAAIDLAAAHRRGIVVSATRADPHGTPELAWGLVLALLRHVPTEDRGVKEGAWQLTIGTGLAGRTLGVLGLGRVGSAVAAVGGAFGMRVIAWSPHLTLERAAAAGAQFVDRDRLFAESDVLTVHVVLGEGTRGLVGASELALMKHTAYLINTSRGPIVDESALVAALEEGSLAGAGLDVYDVEPLPAGHPLLTAPNTVLTPHIGYVTDTGYRTMYADAVEDIAAYLDGKPLREL
jgi:phosphoglycerate dehydrogenase-like enzyme